MSNKIKIITTSILVVVFGLIGWGCYYSYLHMTGQTEAQIKKREQLYRDMNEIIVGGFKFGMSRLEANKVAHSLNYEVENIGGYLNNTGNISALGIDWDYLNLLIDEESGIVQMLFTVKKSKLSKGMVERHLYSFKQLFPQSSERKENMIGSITVGNKTVPISFDYVGFIDIEKDNNQYSGGSFYISSKDELGCLICKKRNKVENVTGK